MYIIGVCKFYGMPREQLDLLFDSLIMSILTYGVELGGALITINILAKLTN